MEKKKYAIKNTLGMYDMLKGIIMIMTMFAHTYGIFQAFTGNAIGIIFIVIFGIFGDASMSSLFMVSGYGFRKTPMKKYIAKQVNALIIPYAITTLVTAILHVISYYLLYGGLRYSVKETIKLFLSFLLCLTNERTNIGGYELGACGPAWFLVALFVGNVVFNFLLQYFQDKKLVLASFLAACLGWLINYAPVIPWAISKGLVAVFFICLGYILKKNKVFTSNVEKRKKVILSIGTFVIFIAFKILFGEFNIAHGQYGFGPVSIAVIGAASILVIYYSLYLNCLTGKISMVIRNIGRNSLYIMCAHSIEIMAAGSYIQYDLVNNWKGNMLLCTGGIFIVRVLVVVTATFAFVWIKRKFLTGRNSI